MLKYELSKLELYSILTGIFCACLIISNIIAFKTFTFFDIILPCSVIIFPITYVINDILAETYGLSKTRRVIYLGFLLNLLAVITFQIAILLPAPDFFTHEAAFETVLGNSFRVLIASFLSFLSGSLLNAHIMVYLKKKSEKNLFLRCILSTVFGEGVDSTIFISVAFFGTMPLTLLIGMIIAQIIIKTVYEIVIYPVTKNLINHIKKLN